MNATTSWLLVCSLLSVSAALRADNKVETIHLADRSPKSAPAPSSAAALATPETNPPQRLSIDYSNDDIREILRRIADQAGIDLILPEGLVGRTSIRLHDVTWQQAFQVILTPVGYDFRIEHGIVKVFAKPDLRGRADVNESDFSVLAVLGGIYALLWIPLGILHLLLAIGVWRDNRATATWPFSKLIWGVEVLAFGLLGLLVYWLIHHSRLAKVPARLD